MKQTVKIKQMICTCKAKEVFFKLISLEDVGKVSLDVPSQSVIIEVKKPISTVSLRAALQPIRLD
ncbi:MULTISPECIES: hypothetical protein [Enterococcus]|uniref:hypothetical protein n=1 Tax=Enterococcus TaxID=1350 RepID=UPI0009E30873|nr:MULTISPECIES: hypothetical protein [Enterococcus]